MASPLAEVRVERLEDGLWLWTGEVEGRGELACLYVESASAISLLDPVLPAEDAERFLRALDRDVARHGGPVDVFFSSDEEHALAGEIVRRYRATVRTSSTADVEITEHGFWLPAHQTRIVHRAIKRC